MTTSVLRGRLVLEDTVVEDGIIEFDGATITRVCPVSEYEGEAPEASDATYLPGLVDVHCHGGGGESFPTPRPPRKPSLRSSSIAVTARPPWSHPA